MTSSPIGRTRPARPPMKYRLTGWMRHRGPEIVRTDRRTLRAAGRQPRDSAGPAPALRAA
jgi:hypothetical protein